MAKKSASYELTLPPRRSPEAAYQWLYEAVRSEILTGRLRAGTRLPASRDFARQYRLSRGTIVNAFDQLRAEGYITGRIGSGTFVSGVLPENLLHVKSKGLGVSAEHARRPAVSNYARRAQMFRCYENRPIRAFRANLPALDLFPTELWTRITTRCLRQISQRRLMGCDPFGYEPLRQAVAEYLGQSRGVRCAAEQVAIVSGVQEAIDLTGRLLVNAGDRVCVEDPGYPGAVLAFRALGAKVVAERVDEDGIAVKRLPRRGVQLIYVTPGHQFPLGVTMSLGRRLELLEWARRSGAMILEDDYDSEYRYAGRPIPALQGLDEHGMVLYAGSFSKVLFPGLRLGYLVAPAQLVGALEAAVSLAVRHAPLLEQLVLREFIAEGHFGRHVRRMREVYAERLSTLREEVRSRLKGMLEISDVEAGLQTVGWLGEGLDAEAVAAAAAQRDVDVLPIGRYSQSGAATNGLQLGFAALDEREIRRGVRELAIAVEGERKTARHGG